MSITETAPTEALRILAPTLPPELRRDLHSRVTAAQLRDNKDNDFTAELRRISRDYKGDTRSLMARATCLLVADLVDQGWRLVIEAERFVFAPPGISRGLDETADEVKARIRRSLKLPRDRQLQEPSVRQFIRRMERRRPQSPFSILDLVDDGADLARALTAAIAAPEAEREAALANVIEPEVQVCDPDAKCPETGLRLIDIWRYFRHTWSLEYRPVPGRQMPLLIRNAARPLKPVIGIAMLASPALRMRTRDAWIGWRLDILEERLASGEWNAETVVRSLDRQISNAIGEIRIDDLVTSAEIEQPTDRVVMRLEQIAAGAAEQRLQELRDHYTSSSDNEANPSAFRRGDPAGDWREASADLLYVRKRADNLAKLLGARRSFLEADVMREPLEGLSRLLGSKVGRRALEVGFTEIRKSGLASRVADVSVCGAVAPYNEILGGKLVTLLLASQEVRDLYRIRYGDQVSLIASQLAGFAVRRPAHLGVLTTTSLYGIGSSQYNRLALRREEHPELNVDVRWEKLGVTEGFGTAHLSSGTVAALRELSAAAHGARRVNNVFGEGSSPRLRQIREGLDVLGVASDQILHHATPRIIYACELIPGAREDLLGLASVTPPEAPRACDIAAAWRRRWLAGRVMRTDSMERLSKLGPLAVRAELWADDDGQFELPLEGD